MPVDGPTLRGMWAAQMRLGGPEDTKLGGVGGQRVDLGAVEGEHDQNMYIYEILKKQNII